LAKKQTLPINDISKIIIKPVDWSFFSTAFIDIYDHTYYWGDFHDEHGGRRVSEENFSKFMVDLFRVFCFLNLAKGLCIQKGSSEEKIKMFKSKMVGLGIMLEILG
jgi:hypothetical protein